MSNNQQNITIKNQFSHNIEKSSIVSITSKSGDISDCDEKYDPDRKSNISSTKQIIIHEIVSHGLKSDKNTNSITILTSNQSESIKICINNHFTNADKGLVMKTEPDSTTNGKNDNIANKELEKKIETKFEIAEDVLVQQKDGKFYLGTVVALSNIRCLVKYDDNTEKWSSFDEITRLSSQNEDDSKPLCVVCKKAKDEDSVQVCDKCGRGYHEGCHKGNFDKEFWICERCFSLEEEIEEALPEFTLTPEESIYNLSTASLESLEPLTNKSQLPYDLDALQWDINHRTNIEQTYCYCGEKGDWMIEMVQCNRCLQWFHAKCIKSLQYPLFHGDRFYIFLCSICNHGHEFIRRLEMKWADVVHLLLFNLIKFNAKKYFNVHKAIVPYVENNLKILQLTDPMLKLTPGGRKEAICSALSAEQNRFKCGSEINKNNELWTLRKQAPPIVPAFKFPPETTITEHILTQMGKENPEYRFIPRVALEKSFANDQKCQDNIRGKEFSNESISEDDSLLAGVTNNCVEDYEMDCDDFKAAIYNNTGKSLSLNDSLFSSNAIDSFSIFKNGETATPPPTSGNRRFNSKSKNGSECYDFYDSSDDTSRTTLDLIIPPPKDFQGMNNPFHKKNMESSVTISAKLNKKGKKIVQNGLGNNNMNVNGLTNGNNNNATKIVKRRLSTMDIMNGPNGDSKKRRIQKNSTIKQIPISSKVLNLVTSDWKSVSSKLNLSANSLMTTPISTPATTPPHLNSPVKKLLVGGGRRLRQRQEKNYAENAARRNSTNSIVHHPSSSSSLCLSLPGSPIKDDDPKDLQNSLNSYFGAARRIENGEKYLIKGKRVSRDGKQQYLIEWYGCSSQI